MEYLEMLNNLASCLSPQNQMESLLVEKIALLIRQLTWNHFIALISTKDALKRQDAVEADP